MEDIVMKDRTYAIHAHAQILHRRKYSFEPYDVLLKEVADNIASVIDDPEMIAVPPGGMIKWKRPTPPFRTLNRNSDQH